VTHVVELRRVSVVLERPVLADVSLVIGPHEVVALVGPNGAGKSTLMDVVVGLRRPTTGEIRVLDGVPPSMRVGFVPQDPSGSLLPWLSIRDNIGLPLRVRGAARDAVARAVDAVVARYDALWHIDLDGDPVRLSGGERQLVALLRALVAGPELLACDEPFSALDAPSRERLRDVMRAACRAEDGPAMLFVSHDVDDVMRLADRVVVLAGRPATLTTDLHTSAPDARARLEAVLRRS